MKVGKGLGWWATRGRMVVLVLLPVTIVLLNGCWEWEVAGPLIGVGATTAGGAAIATTNSVPSARTSEISAGQGGYNSNQPVAHVAQPQLLDHGTGSVATASPSSAPSATHSPTIAAAKDPPKVRRRHKPQTSTRAVAHAAKPQHRDHGSGPVTAASPASKLPEDLSATTIVH